MYSADAVGRISVRWSRSRLLVCARGVRRGIFWPKSSIVTVNLLINLSALLSISQNSMRRLAALFLAGALLCAAQTSTGTIQGRALDPTGASVPDTKITIRNEQTGVTQTLTTNED